MIFAIIPACGRSVRMGRPKLALPLGGRSVIEHVVAALRQGGVEHVLVVVGPHVPQLIPLATSAGAEVLLLPEETADMRATIVYGLRRLEEQFSPRSNDAWFLIPGDHPTLDAAVVRGLLQRRNEQPEHTILIPTYAGKRGHPTLIGWWHVADIRALAAGVGLNSYLRSQAEQTLEVTVASADVLCDLDTPDDYERLGKRFPTLPDE